MDEKNIKMNPLKFVWLDAYEADGEWFTAGDYDAPERYVTTYGYPFAANNYYVSVASTYDEDGDNYAVAINIPWGMVKEITSLHRPGDDRTPVVVDAQMLRRTIENYQQTQD